MTPRRQPPAPESPRSKRTRHSSWLTLTLLLACAHPQRVSWARQYASGDRLYINAPARTLKITTPDSPVGCECELTTTDWRHIKRKIIDLKQAGQQEEPTAAVQRGEGCQVQVALSGDQRDYTLEITADTPCEAAVNGPSRDLQLFVSMMR